MQKNVITWHYNCMQPAQIPSPWRSLYSSRASTEYPRWGNASGHFL